MEPCPFSLIRDCILAEVDSSLADLRQSYDAHGLSMSFTDAKRAYIEHLIIHVASKALNPNTRLVTSLPVEALWCFHLFETESYRRLEQLVIGRLNSESPVNVSGVKHIEHTALREDEEEETYQERLQMTKSMYRMLNFEFLECAHDSCEEAPIGLNTFAARRLGSSSCSSTGCQDKDRGGSSSLEGHNMNSDEIKMLLQSLDVDSIPDEIEPIENVENQAGYRGVNKRKGAKGKTVFSAYIYLNGKMYHFWSGDSARSAGRLHAWASKILHDGQNKNELLSNLTEDVSDENSRTSQDMNRNPNDNKRVQDANDDADVVETKRNSKSKKLELVKKITGLRIEDMPQHVSPIESTMNQYGFQGVGAVDKQYWWPKVQLLGKHYWLRPCKTLLDAAKLYAWAYEIIHGREQLLIAQKNAKDKCRKQTRARSEEMTSSKKQKTSKGCINEKLRSKEKVSFHTKLNSLVIENLPKHIKNPIPSTRNKTGYKGVNETIDGKWTVDIYHEGLRTKVGDKFNSAFEAGKMYSWAFEILHGSDNLQKLSRDAQAKSSKNLNKKACVSDEEIVAMLSSLDVKHLPADIMPLVSNKNPGGYVGLERVKNEWASSIKFKGRRMRLGVFENALDAGKIYAWGFQIIHGEASLRRAYSKRDISLPAHHHDLVLRSSEPPKIVDDQGCQIAENSEIAQLINQGNSKQLNEGFCGEGTQLRLETNGDLDSEDFGGLHAVEPPLQKSSSMSVSRVVDTGARDDYSSHQDECHSNKKCAMSGEEFTVKDEQCRERNILLRVTDEWNGMFDDRCFRAKRSTKVKKLMRSWFKCNRIEPCSSVGLFFKDRFLSFDEKLESFGIDDSAVLSVRKRDYETVNVDAIK